MHKSYSMNLIQWVLTIYLCNPDPYQDTVPQKFPSCQPHPRGNHCSLFHQRLIWPILECHIESCIYPQAAFDLDLQSIVFCVWLLWLSTFLRFSHVVALSIVAYFFINKLPIINLLLSCIPLYVCVTVHPFSCWRAFGDFQFWQLWHGRVLNNVETRLDLHFDAPVPSLNSMTEVT